MTANEIKGIKYYNLEEVSINGFSNFCKNNIPLIIAITITLFLTYGIKLFWYSIGIDTELLMIDKQDSIKWFTQIGRFGLALLTMIIYPRGINPFTSFFIAFCLIWFYTISWCYIFTIFSRETGRNNKLIPFALLFMTMPVWAEQFYFLNQIVPVVLILSLCPYVVYLFYKGFLDNEKGKIICATILLFFMISVYQAIVPMFICGVFACFLLLQENTGYEPKVYSRLCLKLFISLVFSLAVYFFIDRIIVSGVLGYEKAEYLDMMVLWGQKSFKECIFNIITYVYIITIGNYPGVQEIVNPIIAQNARTGIQAVEAINNNLIFGSVLFLPIAFLFLISIIAAKHKLIPPGRKLLYILAGLSIPVCILLPSIMLGARPPIRTLFVIPLAFAFMVFYILRKYRSKTVKMTIACIFAFAAMYQAQITTQLFYSDQMRYNNDVRLAQDIYRLVSAEQPENERFPVAFYGKYKMSSIFYDNSNFLQGNILGYSFFEWGSNPISRTNSALAFMKTLGINFNIADESQFKQARIEVESMPWYPNPNCVKRVDDFIIIRLSEDW